MAACGSVGRTRSISCLFSDGGISLQVHKDEGGRNQGGSWACPLALILYINLPIWTGVYDPESDGMRVRCSVCLFVCVSVFGVDCQGYKRECH